MSIWFPKGKDQQRRVNSKSSLLQMFWPCDPVWPSWFNTLTHHLLETFMSSENMPLPWRHTDGKPAPTYGNIYLLFGSYVMSQFDPVWFARFDTLNLWSLHEGIVKTGHYFPRHKLGAIQLSRDSDHRQWKSSLSKSYKMAGHSNVWNTNPIRPRFCTFHASSAVVACSHLWRHRGIQWKL